MSQNLERLFALEGGAKRRVAKKGSKKASKGKKVMKGGVNGFSIGAPQKSLCQQAKDDLNAKQGSFACTNNPAICKEDIATLITPVIQNCGKELVCKGKLSDAQREIKTNPVEGLKKLAEAKSSCGLAGGAKRKSKKASKGSKKAQKGGAKKGSKKASKGSKKASKGSKKGSKKGSR